MRFFEFQYEDMFQGLNPKSDIYVDMDGVLADFFGEWKKLVGKDWRELGKDEIEPALKIISLLVFAIYFLDFLKYSIPVAILSLIIIFET